MKYAFIQRHRHVWPISVQCRVLQVSVAGYHEHFVRRASEVQRRHLSDDALLVHIKAIYAQTHGGYLSNGSRFSHAPCTIDLLTMLAIGECLGISAVGHVLPSKRIECAERGRLELLPKVLSEGWYWRPRDWVPKRYDSTNCESDAHRQLWNEARRKLDSDGLQRLLMQPK